MRHEPEKQPGGHRFRGAIILRPAALPPPTRWQRLRAFLKRTRVVVAATVAAILAAVGLINASLDLWGWTGAGEGRGDGAVVVGHQTGEPGLVRRALWDAGATGCAPPLPALGPHLVQSPAPADEAALGAGEVGTGHRRLGTFTTAPWAHEEVIDVDPEDFTAEAFLELGAYVTGNQEVREADPVGRAIGDDCAPGAPFFAEYALVVDPGKVEVFIVELVAAGCLCLVRLDLEYWHQDQWRTMTLPEPESDPIPVAGLSPERYGMLYIDNTYAAPPDPARTEKYDCGRVDHPLCQPAALAPPDD